MEYCEVCEFERKNVWPGLVGHPSIKQEISHPENYLYSLFRCLNCKQLWCHYAYEPCSSFPYFVKWPETIEKFKNTEIDKLHKWHSYSINHEVQRLPENKRNPFLTKGQISGCIEKFDDLSREPATFLK